MCDVSGCVYVCICVCLCVFACGAPFDRISIDDTRAVERRLTRQSTLKYLTISESLGE